MAELTVLKTYKLFIGGAFPRSESGKVIAIRDKKEKLLANVCDASRKDLKAAVVAARNAQGAWASRTAYNRSQILYRIAEMLEARKAQFIDELVAQGFTKLFSEKEVKTALERLVYYAGWCDKYVSVYSSVNSVASHTHNFSMPEPMGVVAVLCANKYPLSEFVSAMAACIAGGNTCVMLCSEVYPLSALTFSEVLAVADVPAGVVNILSGTLIELGKHLSEHMDVNALVVGVEDKKLNHNFEQACSANLKRYRNWTLNWQSNKVASARFIMDLQEIKTVWHPLENTGAAGAKY
jgi:acyl-CoA reductase-like NAD-dependent aldehyde dehydrogenase